MVLGTVAFLLLMASQARASVPAGQHAYLPLVVVPVSSVPMLTSTDQLFTLNLHNQARLADGALPLVLDARVSAAAQGHADDMARRGYFSHISPEGKTPWDWLREAGAPFGYAGENIGTGVTGSRDSTVLIQRLFDLMMAETSPNDGHRRNILNPQYRKLGVGVARADNDVYWVCDFTD